MRNCPIILLFDSRYMVIGLMPHRLYDLMLIGFLFKLGFYHQVIVLIGLD
jgi:hypothetical protein